MLENKLYKELVTEKVHGNISQLKMLYLLEKDYGWVRTLACGREQVLGLVVNDKLYAEKGAEEPEIPDDAAVSPFHIDLETIKFKPGKVLMILPVIKIPKIILLKTRAIFQLIHDAIATEAVVYAMFDLTTKEFKIHLCPEQDLNGAHYEVSKEYLNKNICNKTNEVLAFEFHSHPFGTSKGFFSGVDDGNVDNFHTRVYGNITFDPKTKKFGNIKCKFHDFKDYLEPSIFFDEIPAPEEEITAQELVSDEEKKIIEEIVAFNKKAHPSYPLPVRYFPHGDRDYDRDMYELGDDFERRDTYWGRDSGMSFYEKPGRGIDDRVPVLEPRGGKGKSHKRNFPSRGKNGRFEKHGGRGSEDLFYNGATNEWEPRDRRIGFEREDYRREMGRKIMGSTESGYGYLFGVDWKSRLIFDDISAEHLADRIDNSSDDLFVSVEKGKDNLFVLLARGTLEETFGETHGN